MNTATLSPFPPVKRAACLGVAVLGRAIVGAVGNDGIGKNP
jgi:hypothetical protein